MIEVVFLCSCRTVRFGTYDLHELSRDRAVLSRIFRNYPTTNLFRNGDLSTDSYTVKLNTLKSLK